MLFRAKQKPNNNKWVLNGTLIGIFMVANGKLMVLNGT